MPKRVGVVLSGCGALDGSEVREAVLALLSIERGGAEPICCAPDMVQRHPVDHRNGGRIQGTRSVLGEAARIARAELRDLATLALEDVDALVFPGGAGVGNILSNYDDKGTVCDVNEDVARLLKAHLASHRPLGFISLSPILAARVLGPVAGVRITLGPRGTTPAKHAAVMGADVRPCPVNDILIDQQSRVISTPGYMYDDARVVDVAVGIDKLVRTVLSLATDRHPLPPAEQPQPGQQPRQQQGQQPRQQPGQQPRPQQGQQPRPQQGQQPRRQQQGQQPRQQQPRQQQPGQQPRQQQPGQQPRQGQQPRPQNKPAR